MDKKNPTTTVKWKKKKMTKQLEKTEKKKIKINTHILIGTTNGTGRIRRYHRTKRQ